MLTICMIILLHFTTVYSECTHSYNTICDQLSDIKNKEEVSTWTELIVGNVTNSHPLTTYDLHQIIPFIRLISFTVIRQINRLVPLSGLCGFTSNLQLLSFYKNDIKVWESQTIPRLKLKKLSLVNNNIENVEAGAIEPTAEIDILDLSDNKLEVIEKFVFVSFNRAVVTKVLTIRNNRISHIQKDSLPRSLKILNLDGNNLRFIQDEALEGLRKLEELTLSRNRLYSIPDISKLTKLKYVDFSNNLISVIDGKTFHNLKELYFLDLTSNKLTQASLTDFIGVTPSRRTFYLSVGFNNLKNFNFDNITFDSKNEVQLFLYGNPFDCEKFDEIQKAMTTLKIGRNSCDLKFQNEGKTPYCVNYKQIHDYKSHETIEQFLMLIEKNKKLISCDLVPRNLISLYPAICID